MALPPLTPEQRQAALDKAAASRRERAEVKNRLKHSGASIVDVLHEGERNEVIGKMRVIDLLQSMPGLGQGPGPAADGAARHRREPPGARPGHQAGRRARARVRPRVTEPAVHRDRLRRSRLVVLAGPTAVGKGTVAAAIRAATTPRSGSRCRPPPGRRVRARSTACTTGSSPTRSSTRWSPTASCWSGRWCTRPPATAPRGPRSRRRWPRAGRRCSRSTSRAPARCARRCRRRCSSS